MLIEAAQHLGRHPGPLRPFFRCLAPKKNHNVAVLAVARKLAAIAWRMLVTGEPYRYPISRSTESKLSRLRVKATGKCHKSGPAKGTAKLSGGSRTIRPPAEVSRRKRLSLPRPLASGERRSVEAAGCQAFVNQIGQTQVVPRRGANKPKVDEDLCDAPGNPSAKAPGDAAFPGRGCRDMPHPTAQASCPNEPSGESAEVRGPRSPLAQVAAEGFRLPRATGQADESPPPAPLPSPFFQSPRHRHINRITPVGTN